MIYSVYNVTTPVDTVAIVKELNDKMASLLIPVTVFISVLMVPGLFGNLMVCYYYGFVTRRSTNSLFITTLAIYDVIGCMISMPTEIVDVALYYEFTNNAACKILRFVNFFAGIGSVLTLFAVAIDRFRKICRPTSRQMTLRHAKIVSLCLAALAVLLSSPSLAIFGSVTVNIPNDLGLDLKGSDCQTTNDPNLRTYVWVILGIQMLVFIACSCLLIFLYSFIGHKILIYGKQLRKSTRSSSKQMTLSTNETSFTDSASANQRDERFSKETVDNSASSCNVKYNNDKKDTDTFQPLESDRVHDFSSINSTQLKASNLGNADDIKRGKSSEKSKEISKSINGITNETIKITLVMIIVTVVFILSFFPFLSLNIWMRATGKHEAELLSGGDLVLYRIGAKSYLLNNSLNPWIYGIANSSFRDFFFVRPVRKLCKI